LTVSPKLIKHICRVDSTSFLDPKGIFNVDDFTLDATLSDVLTIASARYVYQITIENRTTITCIACVRAGGDYLNHLIIFPSTRFAGFSPNDNISNVFYTKKESALVKSNIFKDKL